MIPAHRHDLLAAHGGSIAQAMIGPDMAPGRAAHNARVAHGGIPPWSFGAASTRRRCSSSTSRFVLPSGRLGHWPRIRLTGFLPGAPCPGGACDRENVGEQGEIEPDGVGAQAFRLPSPDERRDVRALDGRQGATGEGEGG